MEPTSLINTFWKKITLRHIMAATQPLILRGAYL